MYIHSSNSVKCVVIVIVTMCVSRSIAMFGVALSAESADDGGPTDEKTCLPNPAPRLMTPGIMHARKLAFWLTGHAPPTRLPRPTPRFAGMQAAASSWRLGWRNHEAAWSPRHSRWWQQASRVRSGRPELTTASCEVGPLASKKLQPKEVTLSYAACARGGRPEAGGQAAPGRRRGVPEPSG